VRARLRELDAIARTRDQSLAQMALAWILRGGRVTSVLIGASRTSQIEDCTGALKNLEFSREELGRIEAVLARPG
jgi:L-glyceraldehyde 3-phosphate reductase